jgi:Transcriptional repressor
MSVLNQSGEDQVECPLCLEALEVDDINFFPCTCGYQVIFNLKNI